jgi:hypothetical protein
MTDRSDGDAAVLAVSYLLRGHSHDGRGDK